MKEVVIHAGLHKTGSTSIQRSLFFNQHILKKHGYKYLDVDSPNGVKLKNHSGVIINLFRDNPEAHYLIKKNRWDVNEVRKHYIKQLDLNIKDLGKDKLIISGEGISSLDENGLGRLIDYFDGFKLRVIIYVRHPYDAMCSRITDIISIGTRMTLDELEPGHKKILVASKLIKEFKNAIPETEFYSFDDACQQGGPVISFLNLLGITQLKGFTEYEIKRGTSNKLARLGEYINKIEPLQTNQAPNPVRKNYRLRDLEFSRGKFYLTREEAGRFESFIAEERERIKNLTGIEFKADLTYSDDSRLTPDEVNTLIEKSAGINVWLKVLIWEYLQRHSDAGKPEKKSLFMSGEDVMDADVLRETAVFWEKKDIGIAYNFMQLAKLRRPDGVRINEKLDEYRKKLKISDSD